MGWYCPFAITSNEKMREKKEKTCEQFFIIFNQGYENEEKTQIRFAGIIILNNSQNRIIFTQQV